MSVKPRSATVTLGDLEDLLSRKLGEIRNRIDLRDGSVNRLAESIEKLRDEVVIIQDAVHSLRRELSKLRVEHNEHVRLMHAAHDDRPERTPVDRSERRTRKP